MGFLKVLNKRKGKHITQCLMYSRNSINASNFLVGNTTSYKVLPTPMLPSSGLGFSSHYVRLVPFETDPVKEKSIFENQAIYFPIYQKGLFCFVLFCFNLQWKIFKFQFDL